MIQKTECTLKTRHKILIIGGYGQVGRLIAERLAKLFPNRVIIAGRNWQKASSIAASIGFGIKPRSVDILSTDLGNVLNEVALVISCLDQTNSKFVEQCLFESIHYIDISANDKFLAQLEQLDDCAKRHNAIVMLSVGVAPGLSNMLAVQLLKQMKHIARLDIVLEFGLGDQHGKAACEWIFDNFNATYSVQEHGQPKAVKSFGECLNISLWANDLARPAFRFNFPDQHTVRRIYRIPSVSTWLRFDTRVMTWLFYRTLSYRA